MKVLLLKCKLESYSCACFESAPSLHFAKLDVTSSFGVLPQVITWTAAALTSLELRHRLNTNHRLDNSHRLDCCCADNHWLALLLCTQGSSEGGSAALQTG